MLAEEEAQRWDAAPAPPAGPAERQWWVEAADLAWARERAG